MGSARKSKWAFLRGGLGQVSSAPCIHIWERETYDETGKCDAHLNLLIPKTRNLFSF